MTAPATTRRAGPFTGNGATTSFPFTFKVFTAADIQVIRTAAGVETVLTLGSDYSVTLNSDQDADPGGSITYPLTGAALTSAQTLTAIGALPYDQTTDLPTGGNYRAQVVENALDRTVMQIQQVAEELGRSLTLPPGAALADAQLPAPEAGKAIGWNDTATGLRNIDPTTLVTIAAYANWTTDAFTGDGTTTVFALTRDPGSVHNCDVAIGGVVQTPGLDFTVSGTLITFTSAPPAGSANVVVRYGQALPSGVAAAADVTFTASGTGAVSSDVDTELGREVWAEHYGLSTSNTPADNATALLNAIAALRGSAVTLSTDGIGSGSITVYPSGVLNIGAGHFEIAPDVIDLTQDVGLVIRGQGSRRFTNYVRGRTVLLISGTSSGFGIRTKGNGARGLVLEDLDLSYKTSAFTGDILDCYSTPGVTLNRATLCSYGITAGTRLQTARSCVRLTYDEFFSANDSVFDGAIDCVWSDDTREPSAAFSPFGGSMTVFKNCVWYDFSNTGLRHDGNRTRMSLSIIGGIVNPISLDCVRGWDLANVEGLTIMGGAFTPSVGNKATAEWMRLSNCTGKVHSTCFDDLSTAGTVDGKLDISNNRFASTAGLTLMGGVITGSGNEFSAGTYGWRVTTPNYQLTLLLGPDEFKAGVTTAYSLGASQTSVTGRVNYSPTYDASTNKWSCSNPRVRIEAIEATTSSNSGDLNTTRLLSGLTTELTKSGSSQLVNLHVPSGAGEVHRFFKTTGQSAVISCAGGTFFYTGSTATTTTATFASSVVGGYLELESYGTVGWKVTRSSGVTFS